MDTEQPGGKERQDFGRFLSLILRHKPEVAHLTLDAQGFVAVEELIERCVGQGWKINREVLEKLVEEDEKQRYDITPDGQRIRANQGHSIPVDLQLICSSPPHPLYHGTSERSLPAILEQGLTPMNRQYVHLSQDPVTAYKVGRRHGQAVVLQINTQKMLEEGVSFWQSRNGVWLTRGVNPQFLSLWIEEVEHPSKMEE